MLASVHTHRRASCTSQCTGIGFPSCGQVWEGTQGPCGFPCSPSCCYHTYSCRARAVVVFPLSATSSKVTPIYLQNQGHRQELCSKLSWRDFYLQISHPLPKPDLNAGIIWHSSKSHQTNSKHLLTVLSLFQTCEWTQYLTIKGQRWGWNNLSFQVQSSFLMPETKGTVFKGNYEGKPKHLEFSPSQDGPNHCVSLEAK